jgi:hypothetical protein
LNGVIGFTALWLATRKADSRLSVCCAIAAQMQPHNNLAVAARDTTLLKERFDFIPEWRRHQAMTLSNGIFPF